MELVRVSHRDLRERVKVALEDGLGDVGHALRYDMLDTMLQEG